MCISIYPPSPSVVCGSLLDDNQWHDVVIDRESKNISVTVDRLRVTGVSKGPFTVLDIDDSISIGGVKNPNQRGILVQENFRGCIENVIMGKAGKDGKAGSAVDLIEGWWSAMPCGTPWAGSAGPSARQGWIPEVGGSVRAGAVLGLGIGSRYWVMIQKI